MILFNGEEVIYERFPDGTLSMNVADLPFSHVQKPCITWHYENDAEFMVVAFLKGYLDTNNIGDECILDMPFVPNGRMDRVEGNGDVFTFKYFANLINFLGFEHVIVLDAHSDVTGALFHRVAHVFPDNFIKSVIAGLKAQVEVDDLLVFYPDEGSMKRYSKRTDNPYCFGIKNRDWKTGDILNLEIMTNKQQLEGKTILIVDDICSRGTTFYHSALALKELGVKDIYLYITHCEKTILDGKLFTAENIDLIKHIFTTNSIFNKEKIEEYVTALGGEKASLDYVMHVYKSKFTIMDIEGEY